MLLPILCSVMMMVSSIMCAPGQGRNNIMRLAAEDRSNNHSYTSDPSRGTLDPIGGDNLLRSLDSYSGGQVLKSLDGGEGRESMIRQARKDKSKNHRDSSNSNRITLDSIGGGGLIGRSQNSYTGDQLLRSVNQDHVLDSLDGGEGKENTIRLAREDKSNNPHDTSSVVDSLGGGNFVKSRDSNTNENKSDSHHDANNSMHGIVDPLGGGNLIVVDPLGGGNLVVLDPLGGGNLVVVDPLGGGNLVVVDPLGGGNFVVVDPLGGGNLVVVDPLGGGNLVKSRDSYTRPDESNNHHDTRNTRHVIVDPLGGGHLLRSQDSYAREVNANNHRNSNRGTLDRLGGGHLLRSLDSYTGGQVLRSLDGGEGRKDTAQQAREYNFKTSNTIDGIVDELGGANLLAFILMDSFKGGQVRRSLDRNQVLESLEGREGRQNMMRLAREDKSNNHRDTSNSMHAIVDPLGGGNLVRSRESILRSLDRNHMLDSMDGGEVVRMLDAITGGDLLSTLESAEGAAVLRALKSSKQHPKRMLDSVSGWSFGESKRNFDEIDNVGFTGFAKRMSPYYHRQLQAALAKKNFDEIDRAGFETYNKRNFDEIDRTGFETFEKREAKE